MTSSKKATYIAEQGERCDECGLVVAYGEIFHQDSPAHQREKAKLDLKIGSAKRGLGRTQVVVLRLLATNGALTPTELEYHWPTLTKASALSAITRLADRKLVDVANVAWRGSRAYSLTFLGKRVESTITEGDNDGPA